MRFGSYVGEPSVLAGMLCCGIFPIFAAIITPNKLMQINRRLLIAILFISLVDLYFTRSASVMASVLIVLAFMLRKHIGKKAYVMFLTFIITAIYFNEYLQQTILQKIVLELSTINIRSLSWIIGIKATKAYLLAGVGIGQTPFFVANYLPSPVEVPFNMNEFFRVDAMRMTPMNTYLEYMTETGLVGLVLLALFINDLIRFGKSSISHDDGKFVQLAFGTGLSALAIAMNSFPGGFYLGYLNFMIGMYLAGMKLFATANGQLALEE
jgi:O-antigen ligase